MKPFFFIALVHLASARQVSITVNVEESLGSLTPIARFFGADEPNYAYFPDGKALLSDLGQVSSQPAYFRAHNLLTTDDGPRARLKWGSTNAYTEDADGNPVYNWTIVDRIFDAYLARNVKPYVEIGFMPKALSSHPNPYTFNFSSTGSYDVIYTGWSYPPTSYVKWQELVYQWTKHCVARYGKAEVESWFWEVWNEPNIAYWNGTEQEYFMLYDHAVAGVKRALSTAKVGGPAVAGGPGGDFLALFLQHTMNGSNSARGGSGAPLDFISFHAKGSPTFVNATNSIPGHLQMNVSAQLQNVRDAFAVIDAFPSLKNLPIYISEDDPDGCAACETEAYGYRNNLVYPSYTAAAFSRQLDLAMHYNVSLEAALTWAFEYDNHPFFDGFRVLSTNKVGKPILNFFRMFGLLTGDRIEAVSSGQVALEIALKDSIRGSSDVGVLASHDGDKIAILIWNYHDDDLPKPDAEIGLEVTNIPWEGCKTVRNTHYRIDESYSNAYTQWLGMGAPQHPTTAQYDVLQQSGMLQMLDRPETVSIDGGNVRLGFDLPIHALSLVVLERT